MITKPSNSTKPVQHKRLIQYVDFMTWVTLQSDSSRELHISKLNLAIPLPTSRLHLHILFLHFMKMDPVFGLAGVNLMIYES